MRWWAHLVNVEYKQCCSPGSVPISCLQTDWELLARGPTCEKMSRNCEVLAGGAGQQEVWYFRRRQRGRLTLLEYGPEITQRATAVRAVSVGALSCKMKRHVQLSKYSFKPKNMMYFTVALHKIGHSHNKNHLLKPNELGWQKHHPSSLFGTASDPHSCRSKFWVSVNLQFQSVW